MSKKIGIGLIVIGCLLIVLSIILRVASIVVSFAFWLILLLGLGCVIVGANMSRDKDDD